MSFRLFSTNQRSNSPIDLPSSKSISNRLLLINALATKKVELKNISEADDSRLMNALLSSSEKELNAENAGTVVRFLCAYFSIQKGKRIVLTGSERMKERPIKPLVKALEKLGANIQYIEKEGYPPIKIKGERLRKKKVKIDSSKSSQYASAILMIAPYIEGGLKVEIKNATSRPYIDMTLRLMQMAGVVLEQSGDEIKVREGKYKIDPAYSVESDWSSAAFIYQAFALSTLSNVRIHHLQKNSIQGDSATYKIFRKMGVGTEFGPNGVLLKRIPYDEVPLELDLKSQPDLILPVAIAAAFLLPSVKINGVSSLRIKESNRIEALKNELQKLANIVWREEEDSIYLSIEERNKTLDCVAISSYKDHRVAMAFAPLVMIFQCLEIDDPAVVVKSFPTYWQEISKLGIKLGEVI